MLMECGLLNGRNQDAMSRKYMQRQVEAGRQAIVAIRGRRVWP